MKVYFLSDLDYNTNYMYYYKYIMFGSSNGSNSIPNASVSNYTNTGPSGVPMQFPPPSNPVQPSSQPALPLQQNHIFNNKMPPSSCNQQVS